MTRVHFGWQINSIMPGATGKPSTLAILNGTGAPLIGDQFTVSNHSGAASGFIDIGYTFLVQGDETV